MTTQKPIPPLTPQIPKHDGIFVSIEEYVTFVVVGQADLIALYCIIKIELNDVGAGVSMSILTHP